mmetsp:Transcript_35664/g.33807  ORF Transcript_35664/g.33807 Transcript_35664/m.33807 type:complete len:466 (-) Transcript_35664:272-1669(-)|eukprot:CAMPEP_0119033474 /NCGR_PEP_ID=MMETSP1177-20130426/521_1 /TAXON_ID=2985 /ORGANISM="Ochromonas sp, Strain CCMP1899" /LENGTH=465 /DNA_ID=CAMNT_0006990245 /DNA_START=116 /DNA_END=1513 /DNA_ORIENTATION=-
MRLLCEYEGTFYIASGETLIAVNHKITGQMKQYILPSGKGSQITAVTISSDGKSIYAGYANKSICCWDALSGDVLGSVMHSKRPTALVYTVANDQDGLSRSALVVSDKAGLIWGMDVPLFKKQVLLAGHTASVITDMDSDGKFIATADRDEKIRISNFPRMDNIQSFCLAHTNVVTSISFLRYEKDSIMVTCGWDHRLCLWNHVNGSTHDIIHYETPVSNEPALMEGDVIGTNTSETISESLPVLKDDGNIEADAAADAAEDSTEKTYDEEVAGHYPVKIVTAPNSHLIAVIFKNQSNVKIYNAEKTNEPTKLYTFGKEMSKELEATPCDICFTSTNELIVLLPKPFFMQIITFEILSTGTVAASDFEDKLSVISAFKTTCLDQNIDFSQQLVSTEDGVDAEKGIRKHSLDKPFDKNTGIDPDKKKGSKRSRRRAGFEIREKEEKEKLEKLVTSEVKVDDSLEQK